MPGKRRASPGRAHQLRYGQRRIKILPSRNAPETQSPIKGGMIYTTICMLHISRHQIVSIVGGRASPVHTGILCGAPQVPGCGLKMQSVKIMPRPSGDSATQKQAKRSQYEVATAYWKLPPRSLPCGPNWLGATPPTSNQFPKKAHRQNLRRLRWGSRTEPTTKRHWRYAWAQAV